MEAGRLKITLTGGRTIYIRYNNHNQYSYVVLFSLRRLDRVRFDNFDDRWDVSTKPHHFHPRFKKVAMKSNFTGDPSSDMRILSQLILSDDIKKLL